MVKIWLSPLHQDCRAKTVRAVTNLLTYGWECPMASTFQQFPSSLVHISSKNYDRKCIVEILAVQLYWDCRAKFVRAIKNLPNTSRDIHNSSTFQFIWRIFNVRYSYSAHLCYFDVIFRLYANSLKIAESHLHIKCSSPVVHQTIGFCSFRDIRLQRSTFALIWKFSPT